MFLNYYYEKEIYNAFIAIYIYLMAIYYYYFWDDYFMQLII